MLSDVNDSADVVEMRRAAAESTKEPKEDFMVANVCLCEISWRVDEVNRDASKEKQR